MIPISRLIAFDVETQGEKQEYLLQPWRAATYEADIRMYSFAWFNDEGKIKTNLVHPTNRAALSDQFMRIAGQGLHIVGWNTPFDIAWLLGYGLRAEVFANKWLDAMILWQRLETNKMRLKEDGWGKDKQVSFGLKAAVREFFPQLAGYEEGLDFMDLSDEMTAKMSPYCRKDTAFTLALAKIFLEKLSDREVMNAQIEAAALPMVAEAWVSGLHLDTASLDALATSVTVETEEARTKLLANNPDLVEVNLGSPKQLAEVLFNKWGLAPLKTTPAGADSTDKETLYELATIDPRVRLLKDVREGQNNFAKFVDGPRKSMAYHQEAITRPQPRIYGTYSGRVTYSSKQGKNSAEIPTGIALHQWKRGKEFRRVIVAPPGYVLAEFDAAGQEFRWMAIESGDPTMLDLCAPGEDAHSFMGAQVVQRDYRDLVRAVHEEDAEAVKVRKLGKFCNLSYQYRVGVKTATGKARVEYGLDVDRDYIARTLKTYMRSYTGVENYWDRQIGRARTDGCVWTLGGRKLDIRGNWAGRDSWAMESSAINFPIQGVGADQKYLALKALARYINAYDIRFYMELHDGLFFLIPEKGAKDHALKMKAILNALPYKAAWGFVPPIPLPWDLKIGPSWGDLKEVAPV